MTIQEVINLLCEKTKPGPVSGWVDRMAELVASSQCVRLDEIDWQGSPRDVAFRIYCEAERCCALQRLEDAIRE